MDSLFGSHSMVNKEVSESRQIMIIRNDRVEFSKYNSKLHYIAKYALVDGLKLLFILTSIDFIFTNLLNFNSAENLFLNNNLILSITAILVSMAFVQNSVWNSYNHYEVSHD